jgi:hypothetical protein
VNGIVPAQPEGTGPWVVLILDRDPLDPKWLTAAVTDVRPAVLDAAGRHTGQQAAADWVTGIVGYVAALVPVHDALCWRVDEGSPR